MKNVQFKVVKDMLTITVDLSKNFGKSKSGKTVIVASTEGFTRLPGREEFNLGLNLVRKEGEKA